MALLVPDDQRRRPGVLVETLTAHYTSPGRLAKHRRQFEQMTRPPGEDPAAFAIALETWRGGLLWMWIRQLGCN